MGGGSRCVSRRMLNSVNSLPDDSGETDRETDRERERERERCRTAPGKALSFFS